MCCTMGHVGFSSMFIPFYTTRDLLQKIWGRIKSTILKKFQDHCNFFITKMTGIFKMAFSFGDDWSWYSWREVL